jgi:protein-disulfide isomerase
MELKTGDKVVATGFTKSMNDFRRTYTVDRVVNVNGTTRVVFDNGHRFSGTSIDTMKRTIAVEVSLALA